MADFFLPIPRSEFERLVHQSLRAHFELQKGEVHLPLHKLALLEKIWQEIRKVVLPRSSLPLPFALAPSSAPFEDLRPGKVYLLPKEAKLVREYLKDIPFVVDLVPWRGLLELVFPASKEPELLFRFRDYFWVGRYPPCPFCHRRGHHPSACPTLKQRDPVKDLSSLLREKPTDLAQRLNKLVQKREREAEDELLLAGPYPYLRPGFLRPLFTTKAAVWEAMALNPGFDRGGHLFIGLEALFSRALPKAKKHFEEAVQKQDPRPPIGLAFVAFLEGDLAEALYQVENARAEAQTQLFKAYSLFLKGWIFELQGKLFESEELYRQALKEDKSFWPALLHLATIEAKFAPEKVLTLLPQLLHHPLAALSFFLEERFLPWGKEVENLLLEEYEKRQVLALSRLTQAEDALRPVSKALPEEERKSFEETLGEVRKQIYEGGLLDLLEAEKRAFNLSLELQGLGFRQKKKILQKLEAFQTGLVEKEKLWKNYLYQEEGHPFFQTLKRLKEEVKNLQNLSTTQAKDLGLLAQKIKNIEAQWEELEELEEQLRREWIFRRQVSSFAKTFFLLELFLFGLFFLFKNLAPFQTSFSEMANLSSFLALSSLFFGFSLWRSFLQKGRFDPLPRPKR